MSRPFSRIAALVVAMALLAVAGAVQAGTTGNLYGTVTDADGGVLPGVTVEVLSPALQGTRVMVTDAGGVWRATNLTPGLYAVKATLAGFQTAESKGIQVQLDSSARIDQTLHPASGTTIEVTERGPLVEQRSNSVGANYSEELFKALPIGRSYQSIVGMAPGTSSDGAGLTFYGSTGAENNFIIDGVNTTSPAFGTSGKDLNFDFVKEVEIKAGGYEAEFGRATGGIVNVITKSGGNEFHGDGFGYVRSAKLESEAKSNRFGKRVGQLEYDLGGDIGGYAVKDRVWFFGAFNPNYNNVQREAEQGPRVGQTFDNITKKFFYSGKGTFNINSANSIVASVFGDPTRVENPNESGDASSDSLSETGGLDMVTRWTWLPKTSMVFEGQFAVHQQHNDTTPFNGDFASPLISNSVTGERVGYGFFSKEKPQRFAGHGIATFFMGDHEVKGGFDFENNRYDSLRGYTGGGPLVMRPSRNVRSQRFFDGFDANGDPIYHSDGSIRADTTTNNTAFFGQDRWNVTSNFIINAGLRWERQDIKAKGGDSAIIINDNWAPRLGFTWDPTSRGQGKLYASAGYFFESIPQDINNRAFSQEGFHITLYPYAAGVDIANPPLSLSSIDLNHPLVDVFLGGENALVDANLKGQYSRELIFGTEWEVRPKVSVGLRGIYRDLGRIIEDMSPDDGQTYLISNPGKATVAYIDPASGQLISFDASAFPQPKREYKGIEFTVNKRFADNYQLYGSWTVSWFKGNYPGLLSANNGQLDPNITSQYDLVSLLGNRFGMLDNDRRHIVKLGGSYVTPWKLSVGANFALQTGVPINHLGAHPSYGAREAFALPRGAGSDIINNPTAYGLTPDFKPDGARTPIARNLDVNFTYPVTIGSMTLNLYADIFNVMNQQPVTGVDNQYTIDFVDVAANEAAGLTTADIIKKYSVNSKFLSSTAFADPRRARFGAKLTF